MLVVMDKELRTQAGLASALRPVVLRLARRLRQMRDESLQLTNSQLSAIGVLINHGDLLMGELAVLEKVQPPSMTRIVNGLEELGMVTRVAGAEDKRQCRVHLTEQGREVVLADRRRRNAWLAIRIAELAPAEREVLRRAVPILAKVNDA